MKSIRASRFCKKKRISVQFMEVRHYTWFLQILGYLKADGSRIAVTFISAYKILKVQQVNRK